MEYDIAVFIGRFSPLHVGHSFVIEQALCTAQNVIVLVGSSNLPRTYRNPFTFEERKQMIMGEFSDYVDANGNSRVIVLPLNDYTYSDNKWVESVQQTVHVYANKLFKNPSISLIGHSKDHTSFYLKLFPLWGSVDVINNAGINATDVRNYYFSESTANDFLKTSDRLLPKTTLDFLKSFKKTPEYRQILEEYTFVTKYKKSWENAPFKPIFVTVDSIVIQSGHVLLVKRGSFPGKGLLALPGGFLEQDELIEDAMIRELREETRLKVPVPVIKGSIVANKVFDDPHRSSRGRTITHAYLIKLADDVKFPSVRGGDDARSAKWVPLANLNSNEFYEDHYHIIQNMIGLL